MSPKRGLPRAWKCGGVSARRYARACVSPAFSSSRSARAALRVAEVQAQRGPGGHGPYAGEVGQLWQHGEPVPVGRGHPVIGDHDERDAPGVRQRGDAVRQDAQQPVGFLNAPPHVRRIGAEIVSRAVDQ